MHLVWTIEPNGLWERDWIYDLLDGAPVHETEDAGRQGMHPGAMLVINHSYPYMAYLQKYEDAGVPYMVWHLSDETLGDDLGYVGHTACRFVVRNYLHPRLYGNPKVLVVGLGYKTGYADALRGLAGAAAKDLLWSFSGAVWHEDRARCLEVLGGMVGRREVHVSGTGPGAAFGGGLDTATYARMLARSVFVPAPIGQGNLESFRVFEALEAGAIPVVLARQAVQPWWPSYWHGLFPGGGGAPEGAIVIAEDWEDARRQIEAAVAQGVGHLEEKLRKARAFWDGAKAAWRAEIAARVADG